MRRRGEILREKRVIVVCGAGGVGKTTTSASLALAAARAGRRVLVITIDPSKRLAQTLGVSAQRAARRRRSPPSASARSASREPGSLSAWMLDPQAGLGSDGAASLARRRFGAAAAAQPRLSQRDLDDRRHAGVHGGRGAARLRPRRSLRPRRPRHAVRRAMRCASSMRRRARRPSSTDASSSSSCPDRQNRDPPGGHTRVRRPARPRLRRAGPREIQQFFALFEQVLVYLNRNQGEMRDFFAGPQIAFLLVSSPTPEALEEAHYFEEKTRALSLPLAGYILNRSRAWTVDLPLPSEVPLPTRAPRRRPQRSREARALGRSRKRGEAEAPRSKFAPGWPTALPTCSRSRSPSCRPAPRISSRWWRSRKVFEALAR